MAKGKTGKGKGKKSGGAGFTDNYGVNPTPSSASLKATPSAYGKMGGGGGAPPKGTGNLSVSSGGSMFSESLGGNVSQPKKQPSIPSQASLNPKMSPYGRGK